MNSHSILAIGAHPDDVVLGVGGTLARLSGIGYNVTMLSMTSGELGGHAGVREREEAAAADVIGADYSFGNLSDGDVTQRKAMLVITEFLKRLDPAVVFVHDASDTHQDHIAVSRAATVACRSIPNLYFYEGPSSVFFEPTCVVNISDAWTEKLEALAKYTSQMHTRELMSWATSVAQFRAWPRHIGSPCESFKVGHSGLPMLDDPAQAVRFVPQAFAIEA